MKTPFAINLRIALNERDISQSELARRTGVTQSSISDYLNGLYEPKQDKVDLIAGALGVSPSFLIGSNDQVHPRVSQTIYHDEHFKVVSATRKLRKGAEQFLGDQLFSLTEDAPPSDTAEIVTCGSAAAGDGAFNECWQNGTSHSIKNNF